MSGHLRVLHLNEFFDEVKINKNATIADNILFGRVVSEKKNTQEKIDKLIKNAIDKYNLSENIMILGLMHQCGPNGSFLTSEQSLKINVVKSLIKNSEVFVYNEAFSSSDIETQKKIQKVILKWTSQQGLIWIGEQPSLKGFNAHIQMNNGSIAYFKLETNII